MGITEYVLGTSGSDDDLRPHRRDPNLHTRVSILGKLSCQNLVQLGKENPVRNELRQERDRFIRTKRKLKSKASRNPKRRGSTC